ncbi:DUF4260 domain-containing protein [Runella slithyformis]|uniref:DUF4260 family protein n=1 Tax=Runella slithyformis (strain ATCC 29530 / DSM 19594 / LMG 11500 / NCIMB 11436 / LSU 4) TaxID=761193 RepID=A0A7U4E685_RUNSL|nr:DUF4260 domain-containing protein [Runella slithyformis]AEI49346.1 hypothetical protein Runsl_2958 [Runella slithyformis DSM 19594]
MKTTLTLEDIGEFILAVFLFSRLQYAWWWFPALLLLPDLSMIGYLINTKIGAYLYNFVHHKALGISITLVGFALTSSALMLAGIILFAHSAMDRIFGYGLKYTDSFKHTHLGWIGK